MHIKYNNDGVKLINNNGNILSINWSEFWEICRHGRTIDAISEVREYIENCDKIADVNVDKILANEELIEQIADQVIDDRIGNESGDDIYNVAYAVVQIWRDKLCKTTK